MLEYFSALPGNSESDITEPSKNTTTTATGINDATFSAFALPGLRSTFFVPLLKLRERMRMNAHRNATMIRTTNHVSMLWMLMGGWNHQYAAANAKIATIAAIIRRFLLHSAMSSMKCTFGIAPPPFPDLRCRPPAVPSPLLPEKTESTSSAISSSALFAFWVPPKPSTLNPEPPSAAIKASRPLFGLSSMKEFLSYFVSNAKLQVISIPYAPYHTQVQG